MSRWSPSPRVALCAVVALVTPSCNLARNSCTLTTNADGSVTLECPDGNSVTLRDGGCSVADNGDGTQTLTCADGTSVVISSGQSGSGCTVVDNGNGTKTVLCDDGTSVLIANVAAGESCTITDNGNSTSTITCPDGNSVTIANGTPGSVCSVSAPADGTILLTCEDGTEVVLQGGSTNTGECTSFDNGDATRTIVCADGTVVTLLVPPGPGMCLVGDFVALNAADLAVIRRYHCLTGRLTLATSGIADIALPLMQSLGALQVSTTDIETVSLPTLTTISEIRLTGNPLLRSVDCPLVDQLTERLEIADNFTLPAFELPNWVGAIDTVEVRDNPALATWGVTGLQQATSIILANNPSLLTWSAPALRDLELLSVASHATLTGWSAPVLEVVDDVEITTNPALVDFELGIVTTIAGELRLTDNGLTSIPALPALTNVGSLIVGTIRLWRISPASRP